MICLQALHPGLPRSEAVNCEFALRCGAGPQMAMKRVLYVLWAHEGDHWTLANGVLGNWPQVGEMFADLVLGQCHFCQSEISSLDHQGDHVWSENFKTLLSALVSGMQ